MTSAWLIAPRNRRGRRPGWDDHVIDQFKRVPRSRLEPSRISHPYRFVGKIAEEMLPFIVAS